MTSTLVSYTFKIRKSGRPDQAPFPFFVTATSAANPRLERVIARGITEYEEAEKIIADLRAAMQTHQA